MSEPKYKPNDVVYFGRSVGRYDLIVSGVVARSETIIDTPDKHAYYLKDNDDQFDETELYVTFQEAYTV